MCVCNSECGQSIVIDRRPTLNFVRIKLREQGMVMNTIFFLPERYGSQSGFLPSSNLQNGSHFQFMGALAPVFPCFHIHCSVCVCVWGGGDFSGELSLNVYYRLVVHIKLQLIFKKKHCVITINIKKKEII